MKDNVSTLLVLAIISVLVGLLAMPVYSIYHNSLVEHQNYEVITYRKNGVIDSAKIKIFNAQTTANNLREIEILIGIAERALEDMRRAKKEFEDKATTKYANYDVLDRR